MLVKEYVNCLVPALEKHCIRNRQHTLHLFPWISHCPHPKLTLYTHNICIYCLRHNRKQEIEDVQIWLDSLSWKRKEFMWHFQPKHHQLVLSQYQGRKSVGEEATFWKVCPGRREHLKVRDQKEKRWNGICEWVEYRAGTCKSRIKTAGVWQGELVALSNTFFPLSQIIIYRPIIFFCPFNSEFESWLCTLKTVFRSLKTSCSDTMVCISRELMGSSESCVTSICHMVFMLFRSLSRIHILRGQQTRLNWSVQTG